MSRTSAGILLHRARPDGYEVLLGHLGGPFWTRRPRSWGIIKGEVGAGEDPEAAAAREFTEELGLVVPDGDWVGLGEIVQSGGKRVLTWAIEADLDPDTISPGTFEMEWPPRSGRRQRFPEVDRVAWFRPEEARTVIIASQQPVLDRLAELR